MSALVRGTDGILGGGHLEAFVAEVSWRAGPVNADVVVVCCTAAGMAVGLQHLVLWNNKVSEDRAVFLLDDIGGGERQSAQVMVDLTALTPEAVRIDFVLVTTRTGQTLQAVTNLRLDVWDPSDGRTLASYAVQDVGLCNCFVVGRVERKGSSAWSLHAAGDRYDSDFGSLVRDYGIPIH